MWNSNGIDSVSESDWSINGTAVRNSVYVPLNSSKDLSSFLNLFIEYKEKNNERISSFLLFFIGVLYEKSIWHILDVYFCIFGIC